MTTKLDFYESIDKPLSKSEAHDLMDIMNEHIETLREHISGLQYAVDKLRYPEEFDEKTGDEFKVDNVYDLMDKIKKTNLESAYIESSFDSYFICDRRED